MRIVLGMGERSSLQTSDELHLARSQSDLLRVESVVDSELVLVLK
eukprot:CAMPEP_0172554088 /NCGR_PEP_ID=MMETSP1067-20121228/53151_1 /TAXON_ID=265564 ORGANISM="Thalassiosira punctigera, Strain Tpunct2005C2" /NCGR_SAMPLE_ID=MMETSP1067 /ASSEMBLY_ACC=CAM_ASM_000444 /LENGTH=44 /DNA_ID= /DNA_START= /DNA_END= /DNA_ORIENTATION=